MRVIYEQLNWFMLQTVPLNKEFLPVWSDERADGDGSLQPLFNIQVTGRFVKHKTAVETQ